MRYLQQWDLTTQFCEQITAVSIALCCLGQPGTLPTNYTSGIGIIFLTTCASENSFIQFHVSNHYFKSVLILFCILIRLSSVKSSNDSFRFYCFHYYYISLIARVQHGKPLFGDLYSQKIVTNFQQGQCRWDCEQPHTLWMIQIQSCELMAKLSNRALAQCS